jgi:hypothetical protein
MLKKLIIISFILIATNAFSQNKKSEVIQLGIETKRYYEQDIKNGDTEPTLYKEEFFNFRGELIETKEYSKKDNKITLWFKYKYDHEGNLIEEKELNEKGVQKSRTVDKFEKGYRVERLYYDDKDRLIKKRVYKYDLRK